ncbi:MAG: sugar phosphate isomerase/epimerase [Anaerolineae bacterium]
MQIGIQTRPWGPEANRQRLADVLADVKAAGYDGIEIGAQHLDVSQPAPFRRLLDDHGLAVAGIHVGGEIWNPQAVRDALARLEQTMAFAAAAGAPHLCFSGAMKQGKSEAELAQAAENLNRIGELARGHGLILAYHNHFWEIEDDCRELRYLRDHTDPALVSFLLDVAWVQRGGGDPVAVAREFLPRIAYFHLKDTRGTEWLELGEGDVDLCGVIEVMRGKELSWAVVEQDETKRPPVESARMSRDFLREKFGV